MNFRFAVMSASMVALAACGGIDLLGDAGTDAGTDAGVSYVFNTGTYAVTNATVAAGTTDQCGLIGAYQDASKKIGVEVNGTVVTFNLANDSAAPADTLPKAVLAGNSIGSATEANYTIAYGTPVTCTVRVKRTVVGNVVNNGTAALTLSFSVAQETGNCSSGTSFAAVPCASSYQFTATKQ